MDSEAMQRCLELLEIYVPLATIEAWTPGQKYHAERWFQQRWDDANDNDVSGDTQIPRPAFLPAARGWKGGREQSAGGFRPEED